MKKPTSVISHAPGGDVGQQRARDLVVGEHPAKGRRGADAEQRDRGKPAGFGQCVIELLCVHLAIDEDRQHGRVDHGDAGRFGRGEPAEQDAADDDERRHQRRHRLRRGAEELA